MHKMQRGAAKVFKTILLTALSLIVIKQIKDGWRDVRKCVYCCVYWVIRLPDVLVILGTFVLFP